MRLVNVHAAKSSLSELLRSVEQGEQVSICRDGVPIADLVPHRRRDRLEVNKHLKPIQINFDPTEPLAEDDWPKDAR